MKNLRIITAPDCFSVIVVDPSQDDGLLEGHMAPSGKDIYRIVGCYASFAVGCSFTESRVQVTNTQKKQAVGSYKRERFRAFSHKFHA